MSAYESMGGGLKLKGSSDGIKKKKKAKPDPAKVEAAGKEAKEREKEGKPGKTAAELKFEEMQRKRQADKISKMASRSHKDRVAEYNDKLEKIPEHYDIPKVGPG